MPAQRFTPLIVLLAICATFAHAQQPSGAPAGSKPAFTFDGVKYLHRWSKGTQHEWTPENQPDLKTWTEMVTVNVYPEAKDGDALAARANAVLENYKGAGARVLRTDSVPATKDRPAEHFIAVVFGQPTFLEVAFARFKLQENTGCSIVYSHRIYGEKVGPQASEWLGKNGEKMEKALMSWDSIPSPAELQKQVL
jgi:hypothetical protein